MKKFLLAVVFICISGLAAAQGSAVIRGQVSAGVYENLISDGFGHLIISGSGGGPITAATCAATSITVTNSSQALVATLAARKSLMIQNNDATGIVYFAFGATAATTLLAKLVPGSNAYFSTVVPTQAVNLIGSIASNANVAVVECQ